MKMMFLDGLSEEWLDKFFGYYLKDLKNDKESTILMFSSPIEIPEGIKKRCIIFDYNKQTKTKMLIPEMESVNVVDYIKQKEADK